jgi:hypothetical protein
VAAWLAASTHLTVLHASQSWRIYRRHKLMNPLYRRPATVRSYRLATPFRAVEAFLSEEDSYDTHQCS